MIGFTLVLEHCVSLNAALSLCRYILWWYFIVSLHFMLVLTSFLDWINIVQAWRLTFEKELYSERDMCCYRVPFDFVVSLQAWHQHYQSQNLRWLGALKVARTRRLLIILVRKQRDCAHTLQVFMQCKHELEERQQVERLRCVTAQSHLTDCKGAEWLDVCSIISYSSM